MSARAAADHRLAPVVLRPSGWFLGASLLTPASLLILGSWGALGAGRLALIPVALLVAGAVLGAIVVVDLPVQVRFGPEGVTRRCLLRRQVVAWDDVTALSRTRASRDGQRLLGRAVVAGPRTHVGGLVALVGPKRRRYLLTDRQERPDQFDQLRRRVATWAPGLPLPGPPRGAG